ncbi:MAG: 23S rRNA (adenine(1618)-N(6))-methyltransferase RlmF [Opitutaceae bacterium]|nr:23S rRNA (adenine(1618)-N(6))-methyltransferase RlmF [Opitutaceae bacterium]
MKPRKFGAAAPPPRQSAPAAPRLSETRRGRRVANQTVGHTNPAAPRKPGLHPRNPHGAGYDFPALIRVAPDLARFVHPSPVGRPTINFADPAAVLALNRALLRHHHGIEGWSIPPGYLCPPIPGRADYLHHLADLLGEPHGPGTTILDVGTGANCIYPLLGAASFGWSFVGTDIDPIALEAAQRNVAANPRLAGRIALRLQRDPRKIFAGVTAPGERFAACVCNPPFHASAAEADAGTRRKLRNLGLSLKREPARNFGGHARELWCEGGEAAFIRRMITESAARPELCRWFTTLVSKDEHVPGLHGAIRAAGATALRTIDLAPGQKRARIVAWSFASESGRLQ